MALNVNKAIIIGRVGNDPELRGQNRDILSLSVATSEVWRDGHGDQQEKTQWHRVVVFNKHFVDFGAKFVKKGAMVYIEGQIETRKWEREHGLEPVYFTEIILRPYSGSLQVLPYKREDEKEMVFHDNQKAARPTSKDLDDEIPF